MEELKFKAAYFAYKPITLIGWTTGWTLQAKRA
jgi:hypothetical protein